MNFDLNFRWSLFLRVQLRIFPVFQIMAWCGPGHKPLSEAMMVTLPMLYICITLRKWVNTLRPRQNGRHFPDDILKCIFLNENVWLSIKISWNFVPQGPINNIPALVQIMAGRRPGDKPLSEPMMVILLTHICVTRRQWVKDQCEIHWW